MNTNLIIYIALMATTAITTVVANIIVNAKRNKQNNEVFTRDNLIHFENSLEEYKTKYNIDNADSIIEICNKIGWSVVECKDLPHSAEAKLSENKEIKVLQSLSVSEKNFDTAHEVAHIIRGTTAEMTRTKHSIKSRDIEEQICDYYAAALLLPLKEMQERMKTSQYEKMNKREKLRFISDIAARKEVREEVVMRRIIEVKKIINEI